MIVHTCSIGLNLIFRNTQGVMYQDSKQSVGQRWVMVADNSWVIFLSIKFILIMQNLYNLLLGENSVILFNNNNFMIYLVILSDFDNLKLDKILEIFI